MKREIFLSGIGAVAAIGTLAYPAGLLNPVFLTGHDDTTGSLEGTGLRTITGDEISTHYGIVQVEIAVENGVITDIATLQAPTGRNQQWSDAAIPRLTEAALAAQSADISTVSGATYTSQGFIESLASAISQI